MKKSINIYAYLEDDATLWNVLDEFYIYTKIKSYDDLPVAAQAYLKRIGEIVDVPIDIISTGPDREETIVLKHPFE